MSRKSYSHVTRAGVGLIVLMLAVGFAAFNTANNVLFLAFSFLCASLVGSGLMSVINYRALSWELSVPSRMRVGEPGLVRVHLSNGKRWLPSMALWGVFEAECSGLEARVPMRGRLHGGVTTEVDWLLTPRRRGRERVWVHGWGSRFPFGFLEKQWGDSLGHEVTVWPGRMDYRIWRQGSGLRRSEGGRRARRGDGVDLRGVREYVAGDAPRRVHWKASARQGKLLVKELEAEGSARYWVVVRPELSVWGEGERLEGLCAAAASVAEDFFGKGENLAGWSVGGESRRVRMRGDLWEFLDRLAKLEGSEGVAEAVVPAGVQRVTFRPGRDGRIGIEIDGREAGAAQ